MAMGAMMGWIAARKHSVKGRLSWGERASMSAYVESEDSNDPRMLLSQALIALLSENCSLAYSLASRALQHQGRHETDCRLIRAATGIWVPTASPYDIIRDAGFVLAHLDNAILCKVTLPAPAALASYSMAMAHVDLHCFQEGAEDATHALRCCRRNAPENSRLLSDIFLVRGRAHHALRNLEEAVSDYSEAIQHDPTSSVSWNNRARVRQELGHLKPSLEDVTESIGLRPTCDNHFNRGNVLFCLERFEETIEDYSMAIQLNPPHDTQFHALICNNRGNAYRRVGKLQLALDDYRTCVGIVPSNMSAFRGIGILLYQLRRYTEAIDAISQFLASPRPEDNIALMLMYRAACHFFLQQMDKGIEDGLASIAVKKLGRGSFIAQENGFPSEMKAQQSCELFDCVVRTVENGGVPPSSIIALTTILRSLIEGVVVHYLDNENPRSAEAMEWADKLKSLHLLAFRSRDKNILLSFCSKTGSAKLNCSPLDPLYLCPLKQTIVYHLQDSGQLIWFAFGVQKELFAVRYGGHPVDLSELKRCIETLRADASTIPNLNLSRREMEHEACRTLHDMLLAKIEPLLDRDNRHVTIVPDGLLFRVPFGCLLDGKGKFFIEKYPYNIVPSVRLIHLLDQFQQSTLDPSLIADSARNVRLSIAGMIGGLPDDARFLVDKREALLRRSEVQTFVHAVTESRAYHFDPNLRSQPICMPLIGRDFTCESILNFFALFRPRIIHFCSHSSGCSSAEFAVSSNMNQDVYLNGEIVCSHGSLLRASDIASLDLLGSDLAFLNCCETGGGTLTENEGVLGLTYSFFQAGVTSVVNTLWPLEEAIGSGISRLFYRYLLDKTLTRSRALREAILDMFRIPIERSHLIGRDFPSLWGCVQLSGCPDWGIGYDLPGMHLVGQASGSARVFMIGPNHEQQ